MNSGTSTQRSPAPTASRPSRVWLYVSAVVAAIFTVRVLGAPWPSDFPAAWNDATEPVRGYLAIADRGPFDPTFYDAFRPMGYPLFLWFFGRSTHLVVIAQTAMYGSAVAALCLTATRTLRTRWVVAGALTIFVGMAVQAKFAMWTTQILSEGIALPLGIAVLVAWWRFADQPTAARLYAAWAFVVAWMLVRDGHVVPAVFVLGPLAVVLVVVFRSERRMRDAVVFGAVAMIAAAAYVYVAEGSSNRAMPSFHNVIGTRVLPDAELTEFFVDHGMPLDDALRTRANKHSFQDAFFANTDPEFEAYRDWAEGEGRPVLLVSALTLYEPWRDGFYRELPDALAGDYRRFDSHRVYDRLPREMPLQLGGPTTRQGLVLWTAFATLALAVTAAVDRRGRGRRLAIFAAAALFASWFELYFVWIGDTLEFDRHAVGAMLRLTLAGVIAVATAIDVVVQRRKELQPSKPDPVDA